MDSSYTNPPLKNIVHANEINETKVQWRSKKTNRMYRKKVVFSLNPAPVSRLHIVGRRWTKRVERIKAT